MEDICALAAYCGSSSGDDVNVNLIPCPLRYGYVAKGIGMYWSFKPFHYVDYAECVTGLFLTFRVQDVFMLGHIFSDK